MSELELPRLSSSELVARFGNDEAALRRYRMLVALLREGRPAGEVARTFGVSRESLRRLRHAFRRQGLAALQSRKRGGGHLARGSPLIRAIKQELSADPGVSAITLWRRIQSHLRAEGINPPRSTFYRLLAQLRDEESAAASGRVPVGSLREALGALIEDPPLTLGRSALAALLLPDERDPLQRGRRLHDALCTAIGRLRPSEAGPVLDDPRWRHYLIVAGEYETGEERGALQQALALSASTYSRAKREALERLVALLPVVLSELPPPLPPASMIAPPAPTSTDYDAELEQYMARLRQSGLALIWGPAGVGKLNLAAALAARLQARGQKVVWHAARPSDVETNAGLRLMLALAAAAALDGQHELWDMLAAAEPVSFTRRLELLAATLTGRRWTVIVANTHWLVDSDSARVLDVLTAAQERRDIRLALVGRGLPQWADPERWPPLPFPSDAPSRQVFIGRLANQPSVAPSVGPFLISALRERVIELVATIPAESIEALSPEQIGLLLATLRPIEEIAAELRAAAQARVAPPGTAIE